MPVYKLWVLDRNTHVQCTDPMTHFHFPQLAMLIFCNDCYVGSLAMKSSAYVSVGF